MGFLGRGGMVDRENQAGNIGYGTSLPAAGLSGLTPDLLIPPDPQGDPGPTLESTQAPSMLTLDGQTGLTPDQAVPDAAPQDPNQQGVAPGPQMDLSGLPPGLPPPPQIAQEPFQSQGIQPAGPQLGGPAGAAGVAPAPGAGPSPAEQLLSAFRGGR